jgi:hypothetical protein
MFEFRSVGLPVLVTLMIYHNIPTMSRKISKEVVPLTRWTAPSPVDWGSPGHRNGVIRPPTPALRTDPWEPQGVDGE